MEKFLYSKMKGGWFIGDFEPSVIRTKEFEVGYRKHKKGEPWDKHYHKKAREVTLILRGKVRINDITYSAGDIILIQPNEIVDPEFLEDVEFVVVKIPSDVTDKFVLKR